MNSELNKEPQALACARLHRGRFADSTNHPDLAIYSNINNTIVRALDSGSRDLDYLPGAIRATLSQHEVDTFAREDAVKYIVPFVVLRPVLYDAVEIVAATQTWNIIVEGQHLTGEGQAICVVDTGVDFTHADLSAKNIAGGNFDCVDPIDSDCPLDPTQTDTFGHGTHIAGITAAEGGINGIAKGADIVSMKIDTREDGETNNALLLILDWLNKPHHLGRCSYA